MIIKKMKYFWWVIFLETQKDVCGRNNISSPCRYKGKFENYLYVIVFIV